MEVGLMHQQENAVAHRKVISKVGKMNEIAERPMIPILKETQQFRVPGPFALENNKKSALQKQRENAARLASGRSVVNVDANGKENKNARKLSETFLPKKSVVPQKKTLKKSASVSSLKLEEKVNSQAVKKSVCKLDKEIKLDPTVVDIDKEVLDDEFFLAYYAKDIFLYMRDLEDSQAIKENFLTHKHIMTDAMRSLLVDWMFEVQSSFNLLSETIQMSISLLDRFIQINPSISKDELQLVASTCIWIAAKYEEIYPPELSDIIGIAAKTYTGDQIRLMERRILMGLEFSLGRSPPIVFLRRYARVVNMDPIAYAFAKFFIDLSLVSYTLCHIPPSLLSAAALFLALYLRSEAKEEEEIWSKALEFYSQYSYMTIKPIATKMARVIVNVRRPTFQAVRQKYQDKKKLYEVSNRPELSSVKLSDLIKQSIE